MFHKIKNILLTLFILSAGFSAPSHAEIFGENKPDNYVQVRLITDQTQVSGGETVRIGLEQVIYPQWHTYWKNPGDSGTPTDIQWQLPDGFKTSELEWPTPIKLPFGPLTNYGYEGTVILLQDLKIPENIGSEPFALNATVNLLVCHDICIPESHDTFITFNGDVAAEPETIQATEKTLPTLKKWNAEFKETNGTFIVEVTPENPQDFANITNVQFFPLDWGSVDNTKEAKAVIAGNKIEISQARGERDLTELESLPFVFAYEDQNGIAKSFEAVAKSKPITALKKSSTSTTLIQALIFALLGGLILNLMPCVFPVLSMKALSLVNLQDKEEKKARGYGISYTLGILASFGLIAGVLIALKAGGAQIGWGFQLQNPIIIIALIYLVFIIGLNLIGFFDFTNRLGNIGQKLTQSSGNKGAFFTGVLATIVATPCTAPFMGVAMGFALTQPAAISMLVFLTLGLGLALPYLLLCFIPSLREKLPKPGAWMETFRQLLAFPMFMTSAWLIWVLSQQISSFGVLCLLLGLIAITFIIWLAKNLSNNKALRIFNFVLIVLSAGFILISTFSTTMLVNDNESKIQAGQNWENFSQEKLSDLLRNTDAPIFTNMTASWCITCKVNEKVALKKDKISALFKSQKIQYLKGDWTNHNADITQYLNNFNRQGVPLYVYYGARDEQSGKRPEPVVLPQILTAGLVEKIIRP